MSIHMGSLERHITSGYGKVLSCVPLIGDFMHIFVANLCKEKWENVNKFLNNRKDQDNASYIELQEKITEMRGLNGLLLDYMTTGVLRNVFRIALCVALIATNTMRILPMVLIGMSGSHIFKLLTAMGPLRASMDKLNTDQNLALDY